MSETKNTVKQGPKLVSALSAEYGFAEIIQDIAATAADRERSHRLPYEEIGSLKAQGFGALRLPVKDGGRGASLRELFVVARDIAAADSNIAHAFRNHFWQVEAALRHRDHPFHAHVLRLTQQKKTVGMSFVETGAIAAGARPPTVLSRLEWDERRDAYIGTGKKIYATGNLYNDAFIGTAVESRAGQTVQYVLERSEGIDRHDDWQGFGQQLTGSGTMRFDNVTMPAAHVYPPDPPKSEDASPWGFTFHQVYLTNCIAGIVRRVALDAVNVLHARGRNFYHGDAAHPADEPVLQALLGRIRAYAASIEATADRAADALQHAWNHYGTRDEADTTLAATFAASEAKVVIDDLAPQVASWLIDLGSGSVVSRIGALDRHWRNIKVIASHNPRLYKERLLGENLLHGKLPPTGSFF